MESTTLEEIYYIAELLGVVAVVVTLIFLAVQIRQNTRQLESQALREAIYDFLDSYAKFTADEINAKNFRMGLNKFESLTQEEKAVFHSKGQILINSFFLVLSHHDKGLIDNETFNAMEIFFLKILKSPGANQWWEQFKHHPPKSFTSYIDKRLKEEGSIPALCEDFEWFNSV
jgi:hypothetical protein